MLTEAAGAGEAPDVEGAERFFAEAIDVADGLGMRPLIAHCRLGLGALYRRAERHEASARSFAAAAALFGDLDMPFWLGKTEQASRHDSGAAN